MRAVARNFGEKLSVALRLTAHIDAALDRQVRTSGGEYAKSIYDQQLRPIVDHGCDYIRWCDAVCYDYSHGALRWAA